MKFKLTAFALSLLGISTLIACSFISNDNDQNSWKQFRGNNRDGASMVSAINGSWQDKEPELLWKQNIGSSFSEVLVSGNKIFTMTSVKLDSLSGSEFMVAYSENREELWRTKVDSLFIDPDKFGDGPRSTSALDDQAVYCLSSFGKLKALSKKDGEIIWTVDLPKEFGCKRPGWIYTSSPMLYENELILEVGGTESNGFAAFDKETGQKLWVNGVGIPSYSSPTLASIDGKMQSIFANDSMLISFDKIGNEIWSYEMPFSGPIPTPLFIPPNKIFMSSMDGSFMIKIENNEVTEVFHKNSMRNTFNSSCHFNGHIYGLSNGALKCISATDGESKWSEKGFGLGSLILVGNKLLVLSDKGILKLVEASPEKYVEKGSIQAINGKSWTAPSFANGNVYLRNLTEIVSYKLN